MSWSRKSEYGWKVTLLSAATEFGPVRMTVRWQPAQPRPRKTACPSSACAVIGPRGGGARNVMKSANCLDVGAVVVHSADPGCRRARHSRPAGSSRRETAGLVMPISLT